MNRDVTNQLFSSCNEVSKAHPEMKEKKIIKILVNSWNIFKTFINMYILEPIFDHSYKRTVSSSYFNAVCMDYKVILIQSTSKNDELIFKILYCLKHSCTLP